jgi:hypothetical protein
VKNELTVLRLTIHQYRRLYGALGLFAVFLIGLALAFGPAMSAWAVPLTLLYMVLLIFTLGAFANPDSDLAGDAPALPTFLLRLPVSTRTLALPPLISSILWPALAWVVLAVGFLRPIGVPVPVLWPAALLGAIGPSLMAVQWAPLRSGKLRLMLGLQVPVSLIVIGLWFGNSAAYNPDWVALFFAVFAVASCQIAYRSLATSRISEATRVRKERTFLTELQRRRKIPDEPFRSPLEAQRWLEWQRQGRILPILTATTMALLSFPLLFEHSVRPPNEWESSPLGINIWVSSAFPFLFVVPLAFATVIGMGARPNDTKGSDGAYHLFFATRPAPSEILVQAKNQAGMKSVLVTWAIVLGTLLLWSFTPAQLGYMKGPLWAFFLLTSSLEQLASYILGFVLLVVWTWRNLTVGSFADFLPTRFGKRFYGAAVIFNSIVIAVILNIEAIGSLTSRWSFVAEVLLLTFLAAKVGTALEISRRITELRPSAKGDIRRVFRNWVLGGVATSIGMGTLAQLVLRTQEVPNLLTSPSALVFAGLILMPLGRALASRLALEVGRHSVGEPGVVARWKTRRRERREAESASTLTENLAAARTIPVDSLREERVVAE